MSIGLIVLAAGGSSRMGTPKQLLTFQGETLLRRAVGTALLSTCQPVLVVLGADAQTMRQDISDLPVQIAQNDQWPEGMASSIRCGLRTLLEHSPDAAAALIILCDQPLLTPQILQELARLHAETACKIAACGYPEGAGVPALFARSHFPELLGLTGAQGAKRIILAHPEEIIVVPFPDGQFDVDTPADYERLDGLLTGES